MKKITSITHDQKKLMRDLGRVWHAYASTPMDEGKARKAVCDMYTFLKESEPEIVVTGGPTSAIKTAAERIGVAPGEVTYYTSYWWWCYAARYDWAAQVGVTFDEVKFDLFLRFVRNVPFIVPYRGFAAICQSPEIHWEHAGNTASAVLTPDTQVERMRLHREDGPAAIWPDETALWYIEGVRVTRKIVMEPGTLTLDEIDSEENAEVRRIMIERWGHDRYLRESGAELIDVDYESAQKGAAYRALMRDKRGDQWLVGTDGSTQRTYYMPVPRTATTCAEAHMLICGFDERKILNKS